MITKYDKLIRDRIPEIISSKGKKSVIIMEEDPVKLLNYYEKKINEEFLEIKEATNKKELVEEMADFLEVYYSLINYYKLSLEDIEIIRKEKEEKRGSFSNKILKEVSSD